MKELIGACLFIIFFYTCIYVAIINTKRFTEPQKCKTVLVADYVFLGLTRLSCEVGE